MKNKLYRKQQKKISVLYSDDIKSALYHSIAVFLDRMKGMEIQQKKSYLPGNFYLAEIRWKQ